MPALEMAQEEGTLVRWLQAEGARVRKGEPLMEIETDKAVMEIEASDSGVLANLSAQAGQKIQVGRVIGLLLTEQEYADAEGRAKGTDNTPVISKESAAVQPTTSTLAERPASSQRSGSEPVVPRLRPASPKARRLAAEQGIDISTISGSAHERGLTSADVAGMLKQVPPSQSAEEYVVVPISKMRGIISERLQRSSQEAPHIALTLSIDMGRALQLVKTWDQSANGPLKINAVLAKAVARTLQQFPRLNAHWVKGELREYTPVHLGFAVALDDGLLVPTLRDAHKKEFAAIQSGLDDLFARARSGRLRLDEIKGSTFTISNLGMFGIEQFTAILNPPEVGILSVGAIKDTPAVENGQIVSRPLMQATVNADHRAVDGAAAAKFLAALKQTLEDPQFLSIETAG
jgi:pyruvate dehydrogenase E2 component (dihydrolipoamide acetyltransferase)